MKLAGRIVLVLLVIALAFGTYYVLNMPEKEQEVIEEDMMPEGFTVKTVDEDIKKITLKNGEGVFNFEKENGQWMCVFDERVETVGNTIIAIESMIKETRAIDEIENNTSSLKNYGLDKPVAELNYETVSGSTGFIKLGNPVVNIKMYFTLDNKNIYTMDLSEAGMLLASMKAFLNMNLLTANAEAVSKVTITDKEKIIIVERKSDTELSSNDAAALFTYALRSPVRENASNTAVQSLLQAISGIDATYYNPYLDDETAGFKDSEKSFAVTVSGVTEKFVIGKKIGNTAVYVKKRGVKGAYTVPSEVLKFTECSAFDLVDKHIVLYYINEISGIKIEGFGETFEFTLGEENTLNGKTIDEEKLKDFYESLVGLSYEGSIAYGFKAEKAEADVRITLTRNGKKDVTEYIPYDAMNYAVRRNGSTEFTIQRKYLEKIIALAKEF